jgi:D-sedoheptulose 7-phosphate isomerase
MKAESLVPLLVTAGQKLNEVLLSGGKVLMMGNGGSAADAQHFAAEIVVRYKKDRAAYPAIALNTDASMMTAAGNDYSFDAIFSRQVAAFAKPGDLVVGFTTSGNSANVVEGILEARKRGCFTIGFLGRDGGKLKGLVDLALVVDDDETARIQEVHELMYHILCELFEDGL